MSRFKIGDTVTIASNDLLLDCCQGKRGRIAHLGVGGGWLLCTDHFCPVERVDGELTLVTDLEIAKEIIEAASKGIVEAYRKADTDTLEESRDRGDRLAWAILVEREAPLPWATPEYVQKNPHWH